MAPWAAQPRTDNEAHSMARDSHGHAILNPEMPKSRWRQHQGLRSRELRRHTADHDWTQRDAMHDIGALATRDFVRLNEIAQTPQQAGASALALDCNHGKSFGLESLALLADPRRDHHFESAIPRYLCHGQKMRDKEPVFGDEVKDLGHDGQHSDPSLFRRPLAPPFAAACSNVCYMPRRRRAGQSRR